MSTAARRDAARLAEYVGLFKNALVYTVVMSNVRVVLQEHDESVSLLVLCLIVASTILYKLNVAAEEWAIRLQQSPSLTRSVSSLACFLTGLLSNVAVQYTSQLVAEMASGSLSGVSTNWSLYGAFISILFIYILQKIAAGATLPCVDAIHEHLE